MKISIAMATYNGAQYLPEQLQSFLEQTRMPDELVITDDCSCDDTVNIIQAFARAAPFEVVFTQNTQNLGYAGNFNAALMQTTGDLVFLSDQDDVWFADKLAFIEKLAEKYPDKLAFMNDAELTDGALQRTGLTKLGQIHSAGADKRVLVMGCCAAIRRELLELCCPIPAAYKAHDNWILKFADGLNGKVVSDKVLQYYRRHETNESQYFMNRTTKVNRWHGLWNLLKRIRSEKDTEAAKAAFQQLQLMEKGAIEALGKSERYTDELKHFIVNIQMETDRLRVRAMPLFSRVFAVLKRYLTGKYKNVSGFKSGLRDMLG